MNNLSALFLAAILTQTLSVWGKSTKTPERQLIVSHVNVDSNIPLEMEVFEKNLGLKPGSSLTEKELSNLELRLSKNPRFGNVKLSSEHIEPDQVAINLNISCNWALKEVSVSGAGRYKDELEQAYRSSSPDDFRLNTHSQAIEKVKEKLASHGFFNPEIIDDFELNFSSKTVTVKLCLKLQKSTLINDVKLELFGAIDPKLESIRPKLYAQIKKLAQDKRYDEALLEKCHGQIKDILKSKEIIFSCIDFDFDRSKNFLNVKIGTEFGQLSIINSSEDFLKKSQESRLEERLTIKKPIIEKIIKKDCLDRGFFQAAVPVDAQTDSYSFIPKSPMIIKSAIITDLDEDDQAPEAAAPSKLEGRVFSQELLNKTSELIKQDYVKSGFWDCSVTPKILLVEQNKVAIDFVIKKGSQRVINQIHTHEANIHDQKRIFQQTKTIIRLKKGNLANPYQIEKYKDQILSMLRDEGYFNSKVEVESEQEPKKDQILTTISYKIDPGQKAKFGPIELDNRTKVPDIKIKNHLKFDPGDDWDLSKLKTSIKKIESMGLFKEVRFSCASEFSSSSQIEIPIKLTVTEEKPREFKACAGGSVYGIGLHRSTADIGFSCHLGCMCTIKNPFISADRIQTGFNVTQKKQTAELIYQCPEPLGLPIESKIRGFVGRCGLKDGFVLKQSESNDFVSRVGTQLSLFSESEKRGSIQFCSGFEAICPPTMDRKNPQNWTGYFVIEPAYCLEKISSNWSNRFGNSFVMSSKLIMPIKGKGGFLKTSIKDSVFLPIGSNACLSLEFGFDQNQAVKNGLYPYSGQDKLELIQSKNLNIFPSLSDRYGLPEADQVAWEILEKGPSKSISLVGQLRLRLFGQLAAVAFQGSRFSKEEGLNQASGCGMRYMTPFGMLCVDLSVKWKSGLKISDTCSWRVSLGQSF